MAFACMIAQTKPTHPKTTVEGPRTPAQRTPVVLAHFEFVRPLRLNSKTFLGHWNSPSLSNQLANGMPSNLNKAVASRFVFADVVIETVIPRGLSTLSA